MARVKIDFHVHTFGSSDSTLSFRQLRYLIPRRVDAVVVTDHNTIKEAIKLHNLLGHRIIVGCEIDTGEGEIIGVFMKSEVPKGLGIRATVALLKQQNALVVVPHPYDMKRPSVAQFGRADVVVECEAIEVMNARTKPITDRKALTEALRLGKLVVGGSDAHSFFEVGTVVTVLPTIPRTSEEMRRALQYAKVIGRKRKLWQKGITSTMRAIKSILCGEDEKS